MKIISGTNSGINGGPTENIPEKERCFTKRGTDSRNLDNICHVSGITTGIRYSIFNTGGRHRPSDYVRDSQRCYVQGSRAGWGGSWRRRNRLQKWGTRESVSVYLCFTLVIVNIGRNMKCHHQWSRRGSAPPSVLKFKSKGLITADLHCQVYTPSVENQFN